MKSPRSLIAILTIGCVLVGGSAVGQPVPAPVARPVVATSGPDPILALVAADRADRDFALLVAQAVDRHPALGEAVAQSDQARAARLEARSALFPTVDLTATTSRVLARNFVPTDIDTIYENSRANTRTDLLGSVNQTLFDFGATSNRISATTARLKAAAAGIDDSADRVALAMIAAWYDVFTYRALVALADRRIEGQQALRGDVEARVRQGFSASGDLLRVDSALAATSGRVAGFRRQLANAEARFRELSGEAAPVDVARVPPAGPVLASADAARAEAATAPAVKAAALQAEAARREARAARADRYPNLSTSVDAGRYGILEDKPDYDVRARLTLRQRFSGALIARSQQTDARAVEAIARADRIRQEAERDAAIAWSDVQALDRQVTALQASYVAGRDARALLVERFRVSRGTLFDVLQADDEAFGNAAQFVEAVGERDAARYVLLSRTGRLLATLSIDTNSVRDRLSARRFRP